MQCTKADVAYKTIAASTTVLEAKRSIFRWVWDATKYAEAAHLVWCEPIELV